MAVTFERYLKSGSGLPRRIVLFVQRRRARSSSIVTLNRKSHPEWGRPSCLLFDRLTVPNLVERIVAGHPSTGSGQAIYIEQSACRELSLTVELSCPPCLSRALSRGACRREQGTDRTCAASPAPSLVEGRGTRFLKPENLPVHRSFSEGGRSDPKKSHFPWTDRQSISLSSAILDKCNQVFPIL
jgi:hypothetical protein